MTSLDEGEYGSRFPFKIQLRKEDMMKSRFVLLAFFALLAASLACSFSSIQSPAQQHGIETQAAVVQSTATALAGTETALAQPSNTPTITPTFTPTPTVTPTPGPLVIDDPFDSLSDRWQGCQVCAIKNGALQMGPYPSSNSAQGYITLCKDCGVVRDYKMSVDATYVTGPSDRGFGLVLREDNGSFIDLEITTWQVYGVWLYDSKEGGSWDAWHELLPKGYVPTGQLHPGLLTNHIAVEVSASDTKKDTDVINISINDSPVKMLEIPSGAGHVGLVVGLHSLGVSFDNFHFEGMPIQTPESPSQNG